MKLVRGDRTARQEFLEKRVVELASGLDHPLVGRLGRRKIRLGDRLDVESRAQGFAIPYERAHADHVDASAEGIGLPQRKDDGEWTGAQPVGDHGADAVEI